MSEIASSRLIELATFASGGTPSKETPEYWGGSIPWLTPKDMSGYDGSTQDCVTTAAIGNGTRIAPAGAIFVAVRGMSLHNEIRIVLSDRPMSFNQDIKAIIPKKIDGRFLYYALLTQKPFLLSVVESAGHGTGRLPTDKLSDLLVPQFPAPEQQAIASILGAVDSKIEINRRTNETLEATAQVIFKDWFVDFGPTRAKMEGRAAYLAAEVWSLFPDALDADGRPEGWNAGSLSDVASLNPESWSRATYPETVEYVDLSNTKWGTIEAITPYQSEAAPSRAQRILRPGDTIVGTVRPGNGSYAYVSAQGLTGSTGFAVLRPKNRIFREVVYLAATAKENIDRLAHLADGGAYPAVRPELVQRFHETTPITRSHRSCRSRCEQQVRR